MKTALLEVGVQLVLPQLVQHLPNGLDVLFALTLSVNENVIELHHHKNVKLLGQDLVDIALKYGRCVSQSKRYNLVLKMAIAGHESRFPFIAFPNPHLMVDIGQIELGETSSPT